MSNVCSPQTMGAFWLQMGRYYQQFFNSTLWINDTYMTNYVHAFIFVEYREFICSFW